MRHSLSLSTAAMAIFLLSLHPARLNAQDTTTTYQVINLGTLGGTSSVANTINNRDWAMGAANLAGNAAFHATLWANGFKIDLGTLGGTNSVVAWPVKSNKGLIAGVSELSTQDPLGESFSCPAFFPADGYSCRGFIWQNGTISELPTLGGNNGIASGVSGSGEVVGWAENTVHDSTCIAPQVLQFEAVIYGPAMGDVKELPPLAGDLDGAATAVNNSGQVVGISGTCDNAIGAYTAAHAVLWENGKPTNIGNLGGVGWNTPTAINNLGQVAGFSDLPGDAVNGVLTPNFHAFLWTRQNGIIDLGTLPGDNISEATDINDLGQVLGVSYPSSHVFVWQKGEMTDLNSLLQPGTPLELISAGGINESGEIAGQACIPSDGVCGPDTPAFLAIPIKSR